MNVATQGPVGLPLRRTYTAQVANLSKGYVAIQGNSDMNVLSPAVANAMPIGIIEESTVNIGDAVSVVTGGEALGVIGAAVTAGQFLTSDAIGRLIPVTAQNGLNVVGQARTSGSNPGDGIVVFVSPDPGAGGADGVTHAVAAGAIPVATAAIGLGSAGALAMTLALPTVAQDGTQIYITAETAQAHTVTTPAGGIKGTLHIVTFAARGDGVVLEAMNGTWNVRSLVGAVLS